MRKNPFMALLSATVVSFVLPVSAQARLPRLKPALVPTASVIKLPILVELFHQAARGPLELSDPATMGAADLARRTHAFITESR